MVIAPVLCVPLVAWVPLQPPDAVQDVELAEFHVSVEALPPATDVGFADNVTVTGATTLTVAVATLLIPPAPVQVNEKPVVVESAPVLWLPLAASAPLQPPEAAHDVALIELHVSVVAVPLLTVDWAALNDAVICC